MWNQSGCDTPGGTYADLSPVPKLIVSTQLQELLELISIKKMAQAHMSESEH